VLQHTAARHPGEKGEIGRLITRHRGEKVAGVFGGGGGATEAINQRAEVKSITVLCLDVQIATMASLQCQALVVGKYEVS